MLKLKEKDITLTNFEFDWYEFDRVPNDSTECDDDFLKTGEYLPVVTHIAGHVCFAVNKQ